MVAKIEKLVEAGRFFEAHNLAKSYCEAHPDDLRAAQLCGLSMSKSGAREAAINFLEPLLIKDPNDVETAGILGGVYKEQFKKTAESDYARKSHETYFSNFEKTKSYYTGINAATMSQILGKGIAAREIASEVVEIAMQEDDFWSKATLGEAYLLLKDPVNALKSYKEAAELGSGQFGKMASIYAQLLILEHYIVVPGEIVKLFAPPNIAVFSGHMLDNNREIPRFPSSIEQDIKKEIKQLLVEHNIRIGFSSMACGSDILFVESLLELAGEVNLYLPFNREEFIKTSVSFAGEDWVRRFEKIEQEHAINYISRSAYDNNDLFFRFLAQIMIGSGVMKGSLFYIKPYLLTVASEREVERKVGGTNSIRDMWPYEQSKLNINPDKYLDWSGVAEPSLEETNKPQVRKKTDNRMIQFFIFATLLKDGSESVESIESVNSRVKQEFIEFPGLRRSGVTDDGVFALYSRPHYAMDFALRLLDWCRTAQLQVRIALEAVLMTKGADPIELIESTSNLKSLAFSDACYATMQFAAALSSEQPGRYDFHHVGIIQTGKTDEGQEIYKIDQKVLTALD